MRPNTTNIVRPSGVALRRASTLLGAAFAAAGLSAQTSTPPPDNEDDSVKLEKFEVTGSYLPVAADATAIPVTTIRASDIEATGVKTNVLDLLKKAAPQFTGSANLGANNANVASGSTNGGSQLALRNRSTLVLINGRRVAFAPAGANGGFLFVDVNLIPVSAVESIEILSDGASATYGSDAVAGVVNIKLKSDFQGAEVGGTYGFSDSGLGGSNYEERQAYAVVGASNGRSSLTASFEWFKSDPLIQNERAYSSPIFGTPTYAGVFNVGSTSPYYDPDGKNFYRLNPGVNAPAQNLDLSPAQLVAQGVYSGPYTQDEVQQFFDLSQVPTILIGNERKSAAVAFDHKLTDTVSLFADFLYTNTKTESRLNAQPVSGTVAADDPNNPTDSAVTVRNRFVEYPRYYYADTTGIRGVLGARGTILDRYTWETAVNLNEIKQSFRNTNLIDANAYQAAIDDGSYNPFAVAQAPGVLDGMLGAAHGDYVSRLNSWDGRVAGELLDLPAGPLSLAIGAEVRREALSYVNDRNSRDGLWLNATPDTPFDKNRTIDAYFAEVRVPLIAPGQAVRGVNQLELGAAVRHENYSDVEDSPTVPKYTLRYRPFNDELTFRATYSESFTAPTLYDLFNSGSEGFTSSLALNRASDGVLTSARQYRARSGGNPDLAPSESRNYTVGAVYSPRALKGLTVSLDYFNIDERSLVDSIGEQRILQSVETLGTASPYADLVGIGNFRSRGGSAVTAPGQITTNDSDNVYVEDILINVAGLEQSGYDLKIDYTHQTPTMGRFDFSSTWTFINKFVFQSLPDTAAQDYSGQYSSSSDDFGTIPDWRVYNRVTWNYNSWEVMAANTYLPSVLDSGTLLSTDPDVYQEVKRFYSFDFAVSYAFDASPYRVLRGLRATVGVNNAFDRDIPLIPSDGDNGADTGTYGAIGRFWYVSAAYKF
ncbi:MAG TPA: TonB-dependent receptor [Opitutaceae bacterium]